MKGKKTLAIIATIGASLFLVAAVKPVESSQEEVEDEIQVVPVLPSAESNATELVLVYPKPGDIQKEIPIPTELRLDGFSLGTESDYDPRNKELHNDPLGQSIRLYVDNELYISLNEALIDALDDNEEFYEQVVDTEISLPLATGPHLLRAFPVRSFNESLKGRKCFTWSLFYYKEKSAQTPYDLTKPFLTYNVPLGKIPLTSSKPILLDFYLTNCRISKDGYQVRMTLDGKVRLLSAWVPYYIYGLKKGKHTLRLELLDPSGNLATPNAQLNDVTKEFELY